MVACGGSDDDKGSPGKVDSGVPDSTQGKDLTEQQFQAICDSANEAAAGILSGAEAKKATCGSGAYLATLLSGATGDAADAACKKAYEDCLAEPDESSDDTCTEPTDACTATVGEIETCFTDTLTQAKTLLAELPGCDDLGSDYEPPAELDPPASCAVVEEKCPEALE